MEGELYEVVILGGGPAGLTAGIYAARAGRKTLILAGKSWGGQLMLTTLVENFPGFPEGILGPELMQKIRKQAERLGAEILNVDFVRADFSSFPFRIFTSEKIYQGKSVILATGSAPLWLNVPGEKELRGKGVSVCATCDGFFFKGKKVAVVGGGDSALEEAFFLAKLAKNVFLIHRRDRLRASFLLQEKIKNYPNLQILWEKKVVEILGKGKVEALRLKDTKTGKESLLHLEGVFVAIGQRPESEKLKGIKLDKMGYVQRKKKGEYETATSREGVFVAGDLTDRRYRQAVVAAALGCMAALDADHWLGSFKKKS